MDWKSFVSSLIGDCVWPVVVVALVLFFRVPIKDLIDRMQHFKGFGVDATFFEQQAHNLAGVTERLVTFTPDATTAPEEEPRRVPIEGSKEATVSTEETAWGSSLRDVATNAPRLVILEAWAHVESEIEKLASPRRVRGSTATMLRDLVQGGVIPGRVASVIVELRSMRNEVAHNLDFEVVEDAALDYLDACINTMVVLASLP
jgi:hypothetical protein